MIFEDGEWGMGNRHGVKGEGMGRESLNNT